MQSKIYILDACALIAFLNHEMGSEKLLCLFDEAKSDRCKIIISVVNLCEVYYDCLRIKGLEVATKLLDDLSLLPIVVYRDIGNDLVLEASKFKVGWKLSLADAFAAGLARLKKGYLVTTDHHEFDPIIKSNLIEFFWLR